MIVWDLGSSVVFTSASEYRKKCTKGVKDKRRMLQTKFRAVLEKEKGKYESSGREREKDSIVTKFMFVALELLPTSLSLSL